MKLTRIHSESSDKKVIKRSIRFTKTLPDVSVPEYIDYVKMVNYIEDINPSHIKFDNIVLECDTEVPKYPLYSKMDSKKREEIIKSIPDIDYIPGYYLTYFSYSYDYIVGDHPNPNGEYEEKYHKFLDCAKRNYPYWQTDTHYSNFIVINGEYEFIDLESVFKMKNIHHHYKLFHSGWHNSSGRKPLYDIEKWKELFGDRN